jgi:hypothetical protein
MTYRVSKLKSNDELGVLLQVVVRMGSSCPCEVGMDLASKSSHFTASNCIVALLNQKNH